MKSAVPVLVFLWVAVTTVLTHLITWLADQVSFVSGVEWPIWVWPVITGLHAFFLLLPLLPLAIFWRRDGWQRAAFQTWALAAVLYLLLMPMRLAPRTAAHLAAGLQIGLGLLFIVLLLPLIRRRTTADRRPPTNEHPLSSIPHPPSLSPWSLVLPAVLAWPWLAWGALGSWLDTALNLLAAAVLGVAAGLVLEFFWLRHAGGGQPSAVSGQPPAQDVMADGFVVGAALLMMAAGFGANGSQLLLMLGLPATAWALVGQRSWLSLAVAIGLTAAAPLCLVDPDELLIVLGSGEIPGVALKAALVSMVLAWLVGAFLLWQRPTADRRPPLVAVAVTLWIVGLVLYALVGQPGLHGERLFVILKDQADLSAATAFVDSDERRQFVYTTLVEHAERTQSGLRTDLARLGIAYTPYYLVNAIEAQGGPLHRGWLAGRPEVDRILSSPVLRPLPDELPTAEGDVGAPTDIPWNLAAIGADRVWEELGVTGEGVVVGQSDSGVQADHREVADGYRGGEGDHDYHWLDPWNGSAAPVDYGGHGTHTLGIVLGETTGVAPGASWFGCANLVRNLANPALYLDCMQFMLAPYPQGGDPFEDGDPARAADVLNNSWGCPPIEGCDATVLQAAVAALRAAGIFVVASAGNEGVAGCGSLAHPIALYDEAFSVGSVNQAGDLSFFSSLGPVTADDSGRTKPDLIAPGERVLSAFPQNTYSLADGTSMAGPHVAGVVALMWSANPGLLGHIERTEEIMSETAAPYTGLLPACVTDSNVPNNGVGYGVVDAYAAVQAALAEGR